MIPPINIAIGPSANALAYGFWGNSLYHSFNIIAIPIPAKIIEGINTTSGWLGLKAATIMEIANQLNKI